MNDLKDQYGEELFEHLELLEEQSEQEDKE